MKQEEKYLLTLAALLKNFERAMPSQQNGSEEASFWQTMFNKHFASKPSIKDNKQFLLDLLEKSTADKLSPIFSADLLSEESNKFINDNQQTDDDNSLKPLFSILSKIEIDSKNLELPKNTFYYNPQKLNYKDIFPVEADTGSENITHNKNELNQKITELFNSFFNELSNLPGTEIKTFIDSLLFLYEKYFTSLHSGLTVDDVSFFDHAKSVAALAVCKQYAENPDNAFLIIAADISGIQNFIYNDIELSHTSVTESKGKRLRGKSFYISLLTDLFADYFLRELDLPRTNILMNGGGHFIVIAPNNDQSKKILTEISRKIQNWFYKNFKGDINLIIASLEADDDLYKNFPKWYDAITGKLIVAKRHKNIERLNEIFNFNLDQMDISEYLYQLDNDQKNTFDQKSTEYEKNMYILSALFENIGNDIPYSQYLVEINANREIIGELNSRTKSFVPFPNFEYGYYFAKKNEDVTGLVENAKALNVKNIRILKINDTDYLGNNNSDDVNISYGFKFIGNYAPKDDYGRVMPFTDLAKLNSEDEGNTELDYPLLATVRMDVDNLGAIFSQGLEKGGENSIRTLSRTVAISRQFNLFFGGYLNKIADNWNMYITYSGGDDLFAVGSWINAIGFARNVREDFEKFACNNPNVTISAGIFLHKESYPIGKAAEFAGKAEEEAKNKIDSINEGKSNTKNKIAVFGNVFTWKEFEKYYNYGQELDSIVQKKKGGKSKDEDSITASFIHFLLQKSRMMFTEEGEFNYQEYIRLISKIKYLMARKKITADRISKVMNNEEISKKVLLLSKLVNNKEAVEYFKNFSIPAYYVVLKNRKNKDKKEN
jgi:CRISPR-associated protein Csm1